MRAKWAYTAKGRAMYPRGIAWTSRPTDRSSGIFRPRGSVSKMGHTSRAAWRLILRSRTQCPPKRADAQDFQRRSDLTSAPRRESKARDTCALVAPCSLQSPSERLRNGSVFKAEGVARWPSWSRRPQDLHFLEVLGGRSAAPQQGNAIHQNKNEQTEQAKLDHGAVKNTPGGIGYPRSFFAERRSFQGNHQHASYRSNQAHDQKWLGNHQHVGTNGNAHGVQYLHEHQDDEQFVQHP